jgi:F-type H+-transporting ATPase subunit a
MANPFDPGHLFEHVQDSKTFEVPHAIDFQDPVDGKIKIPQPLMGDEVEGHADGFAITKFMVIEVIVALLISLIFIRLANRMRGGKSPKGRWWNLLESMLVFLRDEVARPAIGHHDGDKFLPFLWTMFFFILGCNLFGLLPWAGSPTGALATTGALAAVTFATVVGAGMLKMGPIGFWTGQVPHMELPFVLAILLKPMIFVIEVMGLLIKHVILAIRLLANMMAGHLVLAVILGFIAATAGQVVWWGVAPVSVFGAMALSMLELFVAFLQAYIFTFLSALFIGMAVHPH